MPHLHETQASKDAELDAEFGQDDKPQAAPEATDQMYLVVIGYDHRYRTVVIADASIPEAALIQMIKDQFGFQMSEQVEVTSIVPERVSAENAETARKLRRLGELQEMLKETKSEIRKSVKWAQEAKEEIKVLQKELGKK